MLGDHMSSLGNSELWGKEQPEKFYDYAFSYLNASIDICNRIKSKTHDSTWADASVCLMLTAHAVELFLKGKLIAIGRQNIWEAKGNRHRAHDIEYLYEHYIENYKKENNKFHCPFQTEYLGFSEEEIDELKQKNRRKPSVTYRYPFRISKESPELRWEDELYVLDPDMFITELENLRSDFYRLTTKK